MKVEEICLGHLAPIVDRCLTCKNDENNHNCSEYHPMQVHTYWVVEVVGKPRELKAKNGESISKC